MTPLPRLFSAGAWLFAAALLFISSHASAATSEFIGRLTIVVTSAKGEKPHTLNYTLKGTHVRMDIDAEGHQMTNIMDLDARTMTMLMHEQQMYMVMKMPDLKKEAEKATASNDSVEVIDTGKTEKILGYLCHEFLVKDKERKTTTNLWLADGLGTFMGLGGGQTGGGGMFGKRRGNAAAKWEEAFKGKSGFPLRVVTYNARNKEDFRMEATKIEKGGVSDSDFAPPSDYQKFEMPNLGSLNPFKRGD